MDETRNIIVAPHFHLMRIVLRVFFFQVFGEYLKQGGKTFLLFWVFPLSFEMFTVVKMFTVLTNDGEKTSR